MCLVCVHYSLKTTHWVNQHGVRSGSLVETSGMTESSIGKGLLPPRLEVAETASGLLCSRERWSAWKTRWQSYALITKLADEEKKFQAAVLVQCFDEPTITLADALPYEDEDHKVDVDKILELLEKHFIGEVNEIFESFQFFTRQQREGESTSTFIAEVRRLAASCGFASLHDRMIRDRIVCGIRDNALRRSFLANKNLTLQKCVDQCKAAESSGQLAQSINCRQATVQHHDQSDAEQVPRPLDLNYVRGPPRRTGRSVTSHAAAVREHTTALALPTSKCRKCGRAHGPKACPAYGKQCRSCGGWNHFAVGCTRNQTHFVRSDDTVEDRLGGSVHDSPFPQVLSLYLTTGDDRPFDVCVSNLQTAADVGSHPDKLLACLKISGKSITFQLDCGAACNVLRRKDLPENAECHPTNKYLRMYDGTLMKPLGKLCATVVNPANGSSYEEEFIVVEGCPISLLGSAACLTMKLLQLRTENVLTVRSADCVTRGLTKQQIVDKFSHLFDNKLGCFDKPVHLELDDRVPPVKMPLRRYPIALKDKLGRELERLESLGVLERVVSPTDWVSSVVVETKKDGSLRICIDPRPLNKALKRCHYPMPVVDDILPDLAHAKVFSVLDLKSGFWHVQVDDSSSTLTTMGTPFGRFRWKRLPFGVAPAPEVFQQRLDEILMDLEGIKVIVNDILVYGEGTTTEEATESHDKRLYALLQRAQVHGLKFNPKKFKHRLPAVPFVGHEMTEKGLKVDSSKVRAVVSMATPHNVAAVRRLMGMANYVSRFLPGLSDVMEPLRRLTRNDVEWWWGPEHDEAVEKVKEALTSAPVLSYFNPKKATIIQADASQVGVGAALLQDGRPVAYASRALTRVEQQYAQIEKELLASLFGLEKFDQYVYGRHVVVQTDHKPLESILKRSLLDAPRRLQRLLMLLQRYDFQLTYVPGKEVPIADALSRAGSPSRDSDDVDIGDAMCAADCHCMTAELRISDPTLQELRKETARDANMQELMTIIQTGWPDRPSQVPLGVRPFYHLRSELVTEQGLVFKGHRCVVPSAMMSNSLRKMHLPHMGLESTLRFSRETVFWPGLNSELKEMIQRCEVCCSMQTKQQKEPLQPHPVPERPWEVVGADLFELNGQTFLVTVDYLSEY